MSKQDEAIRKAAEELDAELSDSSNESGGIIKSLTKSIENLTGLFKAKKLPKDLVDEDDADDPDYDADDAKDEDSKDLDKTAKKAGIERGKDEKRNMGGDIEDMDDVPPEPKSKRTVKGPGAKGKATIDKSGRDDEDAEPMRKAMTQEDFYADLLENESFEEVVEASDALAHMTDVLGKSLSNVHGDIVDINEKVAAIGQAVMVMMKSQQAILKNLEEWASQPVRSTSPGVHINFSGRKPAAAGTITKSQLQGGLKKAVEDGKLEPRWLSLLDTRPVDDVVQMLPADIRQAYLSQ